MLREFYVNTKANNNEIAMLIFIEQLYEKKTLDIFGCFWGQYNVPKWEFITEIYPNKQILNLILMIYDDSNHYFNNTFIINFEIDPVGISGTFNNKCNKYSIDLVSISITTNNVKIFCDVFK